MSGYENYQVEELAQSDSLEYATLFVQSFEDKFAMFSDEEKLQLPQILIDLGNFLPSEYESQYVIKSDGHIVALLSVSYISQKKMPSHKKLREGISLLQKITVRQVINLYVLGMLTMADPRPGDYYVDALAVDTKQRGRGLAQALMEFALDQASSIESIKRVVLDVDSLNIAAQNLYASYNMKAQKAKNNYLAGRFIHSNQSIRMTLDLLKHQ